jgi:divalent metal cation (Fe/Co/Zn/Cd) transporter
MHIYLPDDMSIERAHEVTNSIEEVISDKFDIEATIHVEPISIKPFDDDKNV